MKLFPIPQLQSPLPDTGGSDVWTDYEVVDDHDELTFPRDAEKSPTEREITASSGHVLRINYSETKLRAEGSTFTQRHLRELGVSPRPVAPCPFPKTFPMYLIRGAVLKDHDRIPQHEDLIAGDALVEVDGFDGVDLRAETTATPYVQDPDDQRVEHFGVFLPRLASGGVLKPWKRIVFVSHRWLDPLGSPPHPDDAAGSKLEQLRDLIEDDDYVMLDYVSFPQEDEGAQARAIESLSWFVYHCSRFRVVSPDAEAFDDYLWRGWCQVELLAALCPVLSRTDEHRDGNFYMDFEDTVVTEHYVSAAPNRAVVLGDGLERPVSPRMIRNPRRARFTVPDDALRVQGTLDTVAAALRRGRPRKEQRTGDSEGRMVNHHTVTTSVRFDELSADEVDALLGLLQP